MATWEDIFNSDSEEEEFLGFTEADLPRRNISEEDSGQSDISADEISGESSSEAEESENESDNEEERTSDVEDVVVKDFNKLTGPTTNLSAAKTAGDFFKLVFPEDLIELIVNETNRNAEQKQQQAGSVDKDWTPVNNRDIEAYLAIRFIQGINSLPSERCYWSINPVLGVTKVKNIMSRNRYLKINTYLHFNSSSKALPRDNFNHDKLHHIQPFNDHVSETFAAQYRPNRENAIDEGLKFKGRLGFKQYMPMKPIK